MPERATRSKSLAGVEHHEKSISLAREAIERFQLSDLKPLLRAIELQTRRKELNLAVFGRFKAGKSSFLNQLLGRPLLPVGVLPVTSVVTEIRWGSSESASVLFRKDQGKRAISLAEIANYVSESENPENCKDVELVRVFLPSLERFSGLTLVDTPGLDSLFSQNTEAALSWSSNVDLALVAVAVDPPLTQQDVALVEGLRRFTPNVAILLTKVDTLDASSQREVLTFIENQLKSKFPRGCRVFPFSIKPGYESLRNRFEAEYVSNALESLREGQAAALARKLQTLLHTISDYLKLALNSAEARESDREHLHAQVLGSEDSLGDQKLQFRLLAKHAAGRTRPLIQQRLQKTALPPLQKKLADHFDAEFPAWRGSFAQILSQFESWLQIELENELTTSSAAEAEAFQESLSSFQRQCEERLGTFREQLSERVLRTFGYSLRAAKAEIEVQLPRVPDVSIGKIFDRNWELLSALIPMALVRGLVRRRFEEKIESEIIKNLSRLTSQWEEIIRSAIQATEKEAMGRFEELVITIRRLLSVADLESKTILLSYMEKIAAGSNHLDTAAES